MRIQITSLKGFCVNHRAFIDVLRLVLLQTILKNEWMTANLPFRWIVLCSMVFAAKLFAQQNVGYTNTPIIPGSEWRVHDGTRPQPRVITPGASFSQSAGAPSDAVVLFDGKDLSKWQNNQGAEAKWKVENGYMETVRGGSIRT